MSFINNLKYFLGGAPAAQNRSVPSAATQPATSASDEPQPEIDEEAHKAQLDALLKRAQQQCGRMGESKLTMEHMVLALAENQRFREILSCAEGLSEDELRSAVKKSRIMFNHPDSSADVIESQPSVLSKYGRDLTHLAREKKLDPLIGRNDELRRMINILSRRTKNNPVVLGDSGVGKTALVEGLAQRIADGDVPDSLKGAAIIALDMGLLMAGAMFPGEFEQRMSQVLKELTEAGQQAAQVGATTPLPNASAAAGQPTSYILFIDDIHNVTGPNAQQGGGVMDASMLLKPLLARGELRCIGATTLDKYRRFIEKDPALERRFQQLPITQPSVVETISILRGLRKKYEAHHNIRITDSALVAAAELSARYVTDRFLPDKAIDLVDEATARVKLEIDLKPEALDLLERRIKTMKQEVKLLSRSAAVDKGDASRLAELKAELAALERKARGVDEQFRRELGEVFELEAAEAEVSRLEEALDAEENPQPAQTQEQQQQQQPIGAAQGGKKKKAEGDEVRLRRKQDLLDKLHTAQEALRRKRMSSSVAGSGTSASASGSSLAKRHEVTEADVARVISQWTGIPLTKLVESEADKILHLGDELHRRIIGQEEAVNAVADAIHRSRAGMKDPNGPIASFLFLGPTGVGKTELAKALAAFLFNSEEAIVRLDMSEYMEKHAVSKLIGAPPGYVGFDEGGQLTEAVRRRPYSVVLFDEVEKAHVDVFNLLLQLLDDGRVTDSQGRTVSFKHAIIILTSNLGSGEIYRATNAAGGKSVLGPQADQLKELVMDQVRKHFPPEFLNRLDEFIIFEPLRPDQIAHIVQLRMRGVVSRLREKKVALQLRPSALAWLSKKGYDPIFGARPVKRTIQRELETPLAQALLRGEYMEDDMVVVLAPQGVEHLEFRRLRGGEALSPEDEAADAAASAAAEAASLLAGVAADAAPSSSGTADRSAASDTASTSGSSGGAGAGDGKKAGGGKGPLLPARGGGGSGGGGGKERFDPLKKMSELAQSGVDITQDGAEMNRDAYSLPTNAG